MEGFKKLMLTFAVLCSSTAMAYNVTVTNSHNEPLNIVNTDRAGMKGNFITCGAQNCFFAAANLVTNTGSQELASRSAQEFTFDNQIIVGIPARFLDKAQRESDINAPKYLHACVIEGNATVEFVSNKDKNPTCNCLSGNCYSMAFGISHIDASAAASSSDEK